MNNAERIQEQINNTRRLLWNASQANNAGSVFRLQAELDRLVDRKYAAR